MFVIVIYFSSYLLPSVSLVLPFKSVNCHWLGHATPEACLAHFCHDLHFSMFEHLDNLSESGPNIRVGIPASSHDLAQYRKAIIRDDWSHTLVHHGKSCLHSCHVLEWKQTCNELPKYNAKAIYINLLCVRPMLDHLPAEVER